MLEWAALALRDLGFLLYGGPLVAAAFVVGLVDRVPGLSPWGAVRAVRAWGPGLGLSLGACILGALSAHWLRHGAFVWTWGSPVEQVGLAAWITFLVLWLSNLKLEVWTLEPLRKLDPPATGVADEAAYRAALRAYQRHLWVHAALIVAVFALTRLAEGGPL